MQALSWRFLVCILCGTGWAGVHAQPVIQVSNQTYGSGQSVTVSAVDSVSTQGNVIISSGANVTFQAGDKITLSPGFSVRAGGVFKAKITAHKAQFVRQTVPLQLTPGQTAPVLVTFRNTGTRTWTPAASIKLGSQSPQNNTVWTGSSRVNWGGSDSIQPGQSKVFGFNIMAPATPGSYPFQWMMVQEGVEWFGEFTPLIHIVVGGASTADSDFDGLPDSYTTDTNGDGVPDAVEQALGLDPGQTQPDASARSKSYDYDTLNRLKDGPGGSYNLDEEGNVRGLQ